MKYNILITNDDGINSKGLRALIEVASDFGDVTVVAPENGMSGMSHSISMNNPLYIRRIRISENVTVLAVDGTPVDCVKVAVDYVMQNKPTLLLSGINHGSNSNISVIYSGTMGAAREGSLYSIPSIGFSLTSHDTKADLSVAKYVVREVLEKLLPLNTNPRMCLNVNIPTIPLSELKGIKMCRQTRGYWQENFDKNVCPRGREYVWMLGGFVSEDTEATDNDEWALAHNYAAIVPVHTDTTDYKTLEYFSEKVRFKMRLERIQSSSDARLQVLLELYTASFPVEERRDITQLKNYIDTKQNMYFVALYEELELVGFMVYWDFVEFRYFEYLSVFAHLRNRNLGHKVLQLMQKEISGLRIFEVEIPLEEISRRRVDFYIRNSYQVLKKDYHQPPYVEGGVGCDLWIMGNSSTPKLDEYIDTIYKEIYSCK